MGTDVIINESRREKKEREKKERRSKNPENIFESEPSTEVVIKETKREKKEREKKERKSKTSETISESEQSNEVDTKESKREKKERRSKNSENVSESDHAAEDLGNVSTRRRGKVVETKESIKEASKQETKERHSKVSEVLSEGFTPEDVPESNPATDELQTSNEDLPTNRREKKTRRLKASEIKSDETPEPPSSKEDDVPHEPDHPKAKDITLEDESTPQKTPGRRGRKPKVPKKIPIDEPESKVVDDEVV